MQIYKILLISEHIRQQAGSVGYQFIAGFLAHLQQSATDDVAVLLAEFLYQRTHVGGVASETTNHSHAADTAADLATAREAATEGSGHIHGICRFYRQFVGVGHHHRLTAVAALTVQPAGLIHSFNLSHSC